MAGQNLDQVLGFISRLVAIEHQVETLKATCASLTESNKLLRESVKELQKELSEFEDVETDDDGWMEKLNKILEHPTVLKIAAHPAVQELMQPDVTKAAGAKFRKWLTE